MRYNYEKLDAGMPMQEQKNSTSANVQKQFPWTNSDTVTGATLQSPNSAMWATAQRPNGQPGRYRRIKQLIIFSVPPGTRRRRCNVWATPPSQTRQRKRHLKSQVSQRKVQEVTVSFLGTKSNVSAFQNRTEP